MDSPENQEEPTYSLKALALENCPFYLRGDTLQVKLPGVYSHRTHACMMPVTSFLPLAMQDTVEGRLESGFKHCSCRWAYARVSQLNQPAMDLENILTSEHQITLSFLEQLPSPIARAVRERAQVLRYGKGEQVLEGQVTGAYFYILLAGSVRITTEGNDGRVLELSVLKKGECFGEMSLLTGAATSNRVETTEEVLALAVNRHDFHQLLSEFPLLSIVLYRMLSRRIRASNQRITQLLTPGISGDLSLFGINDVIQSILSARMTGTLHISSSNSQTATFAFYEGDLRHASTRDEEGPDSLFIAFQWKTGSFQFNVHEAPPQENVNGDTMALILDTLRRLDESAMIEKRDSLA